MVQIKVTASLLLAAAAVAPVVAYPVNAEDSLVTSVVTLLIIFRFTDNVFQCSRADNEIASAFSRGFDLEL